MNLKLCIISNNLPPTYGGGGQRIFHQAEYLAKKGYKVSILTTNQEHFSNIHNLEVIKLNFPDWYVNRNGNRTVLKFFKLLGYQFSYFLSLWKILDKNKFSVIHCVSGRLNLSLLSIIIAKFKKIKIILGVTLFGQDDPLAKDDWKFSFLHKKIVFNFADIVLCNSPLLYNVCINAKIKKDKIRLIYNPVNIHKYVPIKSENDLVKERANFGLQNDAKVLISVSIISQRKNTKELISILQGVNKKTKSKLLLVGPYSTTVENSQYFTELLEMIENSELYNNVIFFGQTNSVDEILKIGDVFVFSSLREGLPNAMLEALSCGLPIVCRNISGITDILVEHGKTGFIYNNVEEAINYVMILYDKNEYQRFSNNARKSAEAYFSYDSIMKKYILLYNNFIKTQNK